MSLLDREPLAASPFVPPPIDPGYEEPRATILGRVGHRLAAPLRSPWSWPTRS